MNKLLLVLSMVCYSHSYAGECPLEGAIPSSEPINRYLEVAGKMSCHVTLPETDLYTGASCEIYKSCIESHKYSEDEYQKRKKLALDYISKIHAERILNNQDFGLKNFILFEDTKEYLEANFKDDIDVQNLKGKCIGKMEIKKEKDCDPDIVQKYLDEGAKAYLRKKTLAKQGFTNRSQSINEMQNLINGILQDIEKLSFEEFKLKDNYKKILVILKKDHAIGMMNDQQAQNYIKTIYDSSKEKREESLKKVALGIGVRFNQSSCEVFSHNSHANLQTYCREITSLYNGQRIKLEAFEDEVKDDAFVRKLRCEIFDVPAVVPVPDNNGLTRNQTSSTTHSSSGSRSHVPQVNIGEICTQVVENEHNPPKPKGLLGAIANLFHGVDVSDSHSSSVADSQEISKDHLGDIVSQTSEVVAKELKADDTSSSFSQVADTAFNPSQINPTSQYYNNGNPPSFSPTSSYVAPTATPAEVIPPIPPSAPANGVDNLTANAETKKLSDQLSETQKKLKDLQDQTNENEKKSLEKELAAKQEELVKAKEIQASTKPVSSQMVTRTPNDAISPITQETKVVENRPVDEVQRSTELARPATVVSAQAIAPIGTAGSIAKGTFSSGLNINIVELPKGIDLQNEATSRNFIMEQIVKFAGQPFTVLDPIRGEIEVIPTKGVDGKYVYVTRPIKKDKKVASKKPKDIKPSRAPAAEPVVRSNFYKDLTKETRAAAKQ